MSAANASSSPRRAFGSREVQLGLVERLRQLVVARVVVLRVVVVVVGRLVHLPGLGRHRSRLPLGTALERRPVATASSHSLADMQLREERNALALDGLDLEARVAQRA